MLDGCHHIFHVSNIMSMLKSKWPGPRITFAHLNCPVCKIPIEAEHIEIIDDEIVSQRGLQNDVRAMART